MVSEESIKMLPERHFFQHIASVPWPNLGQYQVDWELGIFTIESWLNSHIGSHLNTWAWDQGQHPYQIGVGFRWDNDRLLFVLRWG